MDKIINSFYLCKWDEREQNPKLQSNSYKSIAHHQAPA